jgi:phosphoserine phosphatase RsbU/P
LKAAHEIQAHLLPHELPQMEPFEIACAWEPARSVGGDYFDVLTLGPDQLGICIADVSGKGITAALLMANLQAAVRAFAPVSSGPGALCGKLNEVLCGSIAPGKFVTFFYGVIDRERLILHFENAGHSSPIVLRGDEATILTEGGTVLGLFPKSVYEERQFALRPGDCLLLTTDGVTEAANEHDEEFGNERVIASARAARSLGAQGIRTRILDDVTRFCDGNFNDDASALDPYSHRRAAIHWRLLLDDGALGNCTSHQPVQRAAVRVDANQIRQAQVIGAAPRVAPQQQSGEPRL